MSTEFWDAHVAFNNYLAGLGSGGGADGGSSEGDGTVKAKSFAGKKGLQLGSWKEDKGRGHTSYARQTLEDKGAAAPTQIIQPYGKVSSFEPAAAADDRGRGNPSYTRTAAAERITRSRTPIGWDNINTALQDQADSVGSFVDEYTAAFGEGGIGTQPGGASQWIDYGQRKERAVKERNAEIRSFLQSNESRIEKDTYDQAMAMLNEMDKTVSSWGIPYKQILDKQMPWNKLGVPTANNGWKATAPSLSFNNAEAEEDPGAQRYLERQGKISAAQQAYDEAVRGLGEVDEALTWGSSSFTPEEWQALKQKRIDFAEKVSESREALRQAREAEDWDGREELIQEYKRLEKLQRTAAMSATTKEEKQLAEQIGKRMQEILQVLREGDTAAGNGERVYSWRDRARAILKGTGAGILGGIGNAAITMADATARENAYGAESLMMDQLQDQNRKAMERAKAEAPELAGLLSAPAGPSAEEKQQQRIEAYESEERKEKWDTIYAWADQISEAGEQEIQRAKEGLSQFGQVGVDIAQNVLEMGFDAGIGALSGGGSLVSMFVRTFGSSAREARKADATLEQQVGFGGAKAIIEVATEKMFDGVAKIYGAGAADEVVEKLIGRLAETPAGRSCLRMIAGAAGEGFEEVVSDLLGPMAEKIYRNESLGELYRQLDLSEILYDFFVGATIGMLGGVTSLANGQDRAANVKLAMRDAGIGSVENQAGTAWDVLSGRVTPEQQEERAMRGTLYAMGYNQGEINKAVQGLRLGSASEKNNNAAPEGTAGVVETVDRNTEGAAASPAPVVNSNSGSGIIWAGSERAEGGRNNAVQEQGQQGVLGQEEAQQAAGGDAGQRGEADLETERASAAEPAGLRAEGAGVPDGSSGRDAGTGARGEAGRVDERTRRHQERRREQGQRAAARRRDGAALRERGEAELVSARELGIRQGTEAQSLTLLPSTAWDEELREVERRVYEQAGYGVMYVLGPIEVQSRSGKTAKVRGVIADGVMILQADHPGTTVTQLADHEIFHALVRSDPELREAARQKILERYTPEELRRMLDSYVTVLSGIYEDMSPEQRAAVIAEELLADAYADINFFGFGADRFGGAVRESAQARAGMRQQEGERETRGPPAELYSYGGERAATADLEALDRAEEMEKRGVSNETIRQSTGWFRGMDGKWRFEIDDSGMQYYRSGDAQFRADHPDYAEYQELMGKILTGDVSQADMARLKELDEIYGRELPRLSYRVREGNATLQNLIQHDALFEAYPFLRDIPVRFVEGLEEKGNYKAERNTIELSTDLMNAPDSTLLHEIQHAIQHHEGFATGASPEYWKQKTGSYDHAGELYRNTAGEIEARDVQARREMGSEQRKKTPPDLGDENTVFAEGRNKSYALRDKKIPTREELDAKDDIPVVDIREEASGSFKEQRNDFLNSEEAQALYSEPALNRDTNEPLFIIPASITHTFSNVGQENILLAKHLREIAENAILTHGEPSRNAPDDHTTGVYKFFGAVQTADGVQPVKLTVKEYNVEGQTLPKAVLDLAKRLETGGTYATLYDGKVLVLEGVEKETSSSAASSTQGNPAPDNHPSVSVISVKDLLDLVKGEDTKYIPQREASVSDLYSADDSEFWESVPEDRELLLNAAARDGANPELTAWEKKQGRIETLERKANNLREAMQEAEDEERDTLQTLLDKTEKQLSRAREDAARMEGSPIVKTALDRERAAWREENPTDAAKAMRTLQQENKAMKELVEYWKGQAKRTSDTERSVMPEDTRRMARALLKEHNSEASTDRIAGALQRLGNYIVSTEGNDLDFSRIMAEARGIAREIIDSAYLFSDYSRDIREGIQDYLRSTRLRISDELRGDIPDFADFRRRNMGALRLANDGLNIDTAYMELSDRFGKGLFPPDVTAHSDQIYQILNALERVQPSYERAYQKGWLRNEVVEHLANDIVDGLLSGDVRQSKTMADRQYEAMGKRNADLSEKNRELQDQLRGEKNTRRQLVQEKVTELRQRSIDRDKAYRKRVEIDKKVKRLAKYLTENSAKNHVPESMKGLVSNLLMSIDTLSPRSGEKAQREYMRRMQEIERVAARQQAYMSGAENENGMFLDLPPELGEILQEHIESIQEAVDGDRTWTTARMDLQQLQELDTILSAVSKAITTSNELMADAQKARVSDVSEQTIRHLDELGEAPTRGLSEKGEKAANFLAFQNTTPYYFFKKFGEGGQRIFRNMQAGWSKLALHAREIIDYSEKAYTAQEAKDAEGDVREFKLSKRLLEQDGTEDLRSTEKESVFLSKAQIMELYALSRRPQALGHMLSAGIRIETIKPKKGGSIRQADNYLLTGEELAEITGTLTEREKAIADELQRYMNTVGSDWGNEVSMARFGYKQFTEENYWPIKTDSRSRGVRDPGADSTNLFRLLNSSFTKATIRDAHNAIVIGSAFDTFANHMADMAKYNALGLPMLDAMKWFSYNSAGAANEAGQYTTESVQKSAERAYGTEAQKYFIQFMKDMNGTHEGGRDLEQLGSRMLSNYKVAAVAANLRVALLQPTAYVRASAVLDAKYMLNGLKMSNKQGRAEALKYSGTAVWKDLGFYDTNINNGLREMIKHTETLSDQIKAGSLKAAEMGDKVTWGAIWNACKAQVQETRHLSGEELNKATAELFDDVIYRTQVMDSTMTRSHNMRQKGVFASMTTAFMAEPTLSYNMLLDAYNEFREEQRRGSDANAALRKSGPKIARSMSAYIATAAAAALAESIMDAWRDDDKYQSYVEKIFEAMFGNGKFLDGNLAQDLMVHNKLPFIKDLESLLRGYSNTRMDTEWLSNVVKTYQVWKETLQLATGALEEPTKVTSYGNMTPYGRWYQTFKTISQMTGLPLGNTMREAAAIWNNTLGHLMDKRLQTYDSGDYKEIKYALNDGYLSDEEAVRYLMEEGVYEDESKARAEVYKWVAEKQGDKITSQQAQAVQALTEQGASAEDAVTAVNDIWAQIEGLEPMAGSDKVTKTQRYSVVVNSDLSIEQQMSMLRVLMSDTELSKTEAAYDFGITPQVYINAKIAFYEVSREMSGDGTVSAEEAQAALERMNDITNSEKAILWQLQNKSWKPAKNPFDTEIGAEVYAALKGEASDGTSQRQETEGKTGGGKNQGLVLGSAKQETQQVVLPEYTGLVLGSAKHKQEETPSPRGGPLVLGSWKGASA